MRHEDLDRNVRDHRQPRVRGNAGSDARGACATPQQTTPSSSEKKIMVTGCLKAAPEMPAERRRRRDDRHGRVDWPPASPFRDDGRAGRTEFF